MDIETEGAGDEYELRGQRINYSKGYDYDGRGGSDRGEEEEYGDYDDDDDVGRDTDRKLWMCTMASEALSPKRWEEEFDVATVHAFDSKTTMKRLVVNGNVCVYVDSSSQFYRMEVGFYVQKKGRLLPESYYKIPKAMKLMKRTMTLKAGSNGSSVVKRVSGKSGGQGVGRRRRRWIWRQSRRRGRRARGRKRGTRIRKTGWRRRRRTAPRGRRRRRMMMMPGDRIMMYRRISTVSLSIGEQVRMKSIKKDISLRSKTEALSRSNVMTASYNMLEAARKNHYIPDLVELLIRNKMSSSSSSRPNESSSPSSESFSSSSSSTKRKRSRNDEDDDGDDDDSDSVKNLREKRGRVEGEEPILSQHVKKIDFDEKGIIKSVPEMKRITESVNVGRMGTPYVRVIYSFSYKIIK